MALWENWMPRAYSLLLHRLVPVKEGTPEVEAESARRMYFKIEYRMGA